ncbi:twin-arginine translocase TatA/TatE family subunit [Streptomyces sp. NBC_01589]|uniref:twin-arginine translocase TatA/TatE family subunit n=1 Tax=unclassified Streptomyces TaxID=2593676 RepID=UPI00386EF0AE
MLRNGPEPWHLSIVAAVPIALSGSEKLPDSARTRGESMRIPKSVRRRPSTRTDHSEPDGAMPRPG